MCCVCVYFAYFPQRKAYDEISFEGSVQTEIKQYSTGEDTEGIQTWGVGVLDKVSSKHLYQKLRFSLYLSESGRFACSCVFRSTKGHLPHSGSAEILELPERVK